MKKFRAFLAVCGAYLQLPSADHRTDPNILPSHDDQHRAFAQGNLQRDVRLSWAQCYQHDQIITCFCPCHACNSILRATAVDADPFNRWASAHDGGIP